MPSIEKRKKGNGNCIAEGQAFLKNAWSLYWNIYEKMLNFQRFGCC